MRSLAVVLKNCNVFSAPAMKNDPQSAARRLTATAYHEAGHAVMALSLGRPIQKVTISPNQLQTGGMRLGACEIKKGCPKASKDAREDEVLILLAGMVAEAHFSGHYCQQGAAGDLRSVRRLLESRASNERQFKRLQQRLLDKTEHLLRDEGHAQAVALIADQLVEKKTISGRAARHFFDQALKQFC
jgi:ATP-dependent Zn protease